MEPDPVEPVPGEIAEAAIYSRLNHVSLPIHVPNMDGLSNQELQAVRAHIQFVGRDARKKANILLGKNEFLRPLWMGTVSLGTRATEETRAEVMGAFERELLRHPVAFVSYSLANSLAVLDSVLRDEAVRRTKIEPTKPEKKK